MNVPRPLVKFKFLLVYMVCIVISSKAPEQHIGHVRNRLILPKRTDLTIKPTKQRFFTETIDYLGGVIRKGRLEIASQITDAIRGQQPSTKLTERRLFP